MSQEQTELLILKGIISDATPQERLDIQLMEEVITDLVKEKPAAAMVAIGLVMLKAQIDPKSFGLPG